jgi:uncharacterized SAM-binding protein YcdF (DUF218 family)
MSRFKYNKKYIFAAFVIVSILVLLIVPRMGSFLVADDDLKSGTVIILMGSIPDRVLEAADVYHEGYAKGIVFVQSYMSGYEKLIVQGITIPGNAAISKMAALGLGIPEELLTLLEGNARSTTDEAKYIREYLRENQEIDTIILVTSQYHSRRSKRIFIRALRELNRDIEVLSSPSKYDDFNAQNWWKERESAKRVVLEYLKLLHFYAWEQFKI